MNLQESGEMYLESILVLTKKKSGVRSIDISEYMGVSKPSVSRAIGLLREGGYITVDRDGYLSLTQMGQKKAEDIFSRHNVITEFLVSLGVDEETAQGDACRIEHHISDKSVMAIKKFIENGKKFN